MAEDVITTASSDRYLSKELAPSPIFSIVDDSVTATASPRITRSGQPSHPSPSRFVSHQVTDSVIRTGLAPAPSSLRGLPSDQNITTPSRSFTSMTLSSKDARSLVSINALPPGSFDSATVTTRVLTSFSLFSEETTTTDLPEPSTSAIPPSSIPDSTTFDRTTDHPSSVSSTMTATKSTKTSVSRTSVPRKPYPKHMFSL